MNTANHVHSNHITNGKEPHENASTTDERDVESSLLNNNNTSPKQPTRRKKCSCCLTLRVFLFALLLISLFVISSIYFYNVFTVCSSQECVLSAGRIMVKMDPSIDPCTDFYTYACGAWINETVSLNHPTMNMLYQTTVTAHDRVVKAILAASAGTFPHALNKGEQAVVKVFRQCATEVESLADVGIEPVVNLLKKLGGWMPDLYEERNKREVSIVAVVEEENEEPLMVLMEDAQQVQQRTRREKYAGEPIEDLLLNYFYNLTTFPLFFAGVQVSYKNSSQHIITIYEQVPLLFNSEFYSGDTPSVERLLAGNEPNVFASMLMKLGENMVEILGEDLTDKSRQRIAGMIELEWRITNCKPRDTPQENDQYDLMEIRELQRIAPTLNWKYFLSRLTGQSLNDNEEVAVKHGIEWLVQLDRILKEYSTTFEKQMILRSYMRWKVLVFYMSYTKTKCPNPEHKILMYILQFYSGPPHLRKEFCVMRLSGIFPLSLPSLLRKMEGVDNVNKNREMVGKLSENVRSAYKSVLQESDILDDFTKKNTIDKLSNIDIKVGFSDKMELVEEMEAEAERAADSFFQSMLVGAVNLYRFNVARLRKPVDQRDWLDTKPALSSVPIHNYERNLVLLPMDVLNQPIADFRQIDSLNYAAIGSILGHEITHAFDGEGKQHGPKGYLGKNFWSKSSREKYKEREDCIVEHYANLTKSSKASQSRYENIADIVGVEVAFKAWREFGSDRWLRTIGLPLSPEQRFFVAYAQGWCALESPPKADGAVHLNERIRVMGTLRNSQSFASAFSCPKHSYMNPENKCKPW